VNVKGIVEHWLRGNKYDGLCSEECGCYVDDLAPCGQFGWDCEPGHVRSGCSCGENCDGEIWPGKREETMNRAELNKRARALQKEFYPGRKIWRREWRDNGTEEMVRWAYIDSDSDEVVVTYESSQGPQGPRSVGDFTLTPPTVPGAYIVDVGDSIVMLYRFDGEQWWKVDPDGNIQGKVNPPTGRKIQIDNDTEGPIFSEVK